MHGTLILLGFSFEFVILFLQAHDCNVNGFQLFERTGKRLLI